jgi:hypothetical protein
VSARHALVPARARVDLADWVELPPHIVLDAERIAAGFEDDTIVIGHSYGRIPSVRWMFKDRYVYEWVSTVELPRVALSRVL